MGDSLPEHINKNLDERDKKYYDEYYNLLNKYSKSLSFNDMEIFKSYNPPKDLYVEIRAVEDIGIIEVKDSGIFSYFCIIYYLFLEFFIFFL